MSVTVYINGKDGPEQIVIPQAASVKIQNVGQDLILVTHANGQMLGAFTAANILGTVQDDVVMR